MELTSGQISEYLATNAFASTRGTARGYTVSGSSARSGASGGRVSTETAGESLKLLGGSIERLDTIASNLQTMLELSREAALASTGDERKAEVYALMRSLSAGIEEVVDKTTFKGEMVFDGSWLRLSGAGASRNLVTQDLHSTGDLGIASSKDGAEIKIGYDEYNTWRNLMAEVDGLNIGEARASEISSSARELADGDYQIEVVYNGPESSVIIQGTDGREISRADGVDLSGSGIETVSFDIGIDLDIHKEQKYDAAFDKYDYENDGPVSLFANMSYTRVSTHDLAGSSAATARAVELQTASLPLTDPNGGTFSFAGTDLGVVAQGKSELPTDQYQVEVDYQGYNSSIYLYDKGGKLIRGYSGIDLSETGKTTVDLENGLLVTLDNQDFVGLRGSMKALVNYQQASQPYETFDFSAFAETVSDALDVVAATTATLNGALEQVKLTTSALNGTLSSDTSNTATSLIGNALSGSSSALSLISNGSNDPTDSMLNIASSMINNTLLNAMGTQANQGSGSLLSLLSGTAANTLGSGNLPTNIKLP